VGINGHRGGGGVGWSDGLGGTVCGVGGGGRGRSEGGDVHWGGAEGGGCEGGLWTRGARGGLDASRDGTVKARGGRCSHG
jgi:hypothetical protein